LEDNKVLIFLGIDGCKMILKGICMPVHFLPQFIIDHGIFELPLAEKKFAWDTISSKQGP